MSSSSDINEHDVHSDDHPQLGRGRDDSSSRESGISMQSLEDSLPQPASINQQANATATAAQLEDGEEQHHPDHQFEKALRRYSTEIAVHTAAMFETCYGSEGPSSPASGDAERAATPTTANSSSRKPSKRSSATYPRTKGNNQKGEEHDENLKERESQAAAREQ